MRESFLHNTGQVPKMSLLIKDHKVISPGELPSTRPVVNASQGMNVPLNLILSEILEPIPSEQARDLEVISTEHMIHKYDNLSREWNL